ncbi:MAG: hypothetical protein K2J63_01790 [Muribaculaceae bacterium]|nr:hypothetical protein [Muribaculaceae bacterium]
MKRKLKYLLAIAAILILCGCEEKPKTKTYVGNSRTMWVDTINIHGNPHEILLRRTSNSREAVGGMMHSPECWCGKGGGR